MIMPYWLGYSVYTSQNASTSVSFCLAAKDTPGLCPIFLGTVYIAPKILVIVSVLPWQPKKKDLSLTQKAMDEHRIYDLK